MDQEALRQQLSATFARVEGTSVPFIILNNPFAAIGATIAFAAPDRATEPVLVTTITALAVYESGAMRVEVAARTYGTLRIEWLAYDPGPHEWRLWLVNEHGTPGTVTGDAIIIPAQ